MENKLPKDKFLMPNANQSVLFTRFERQLEARPLIIFYDEFQELYYYLKVRGANRKNGELKPAKYGEILIPKAKSGYLVKDSYIDTTQIHIIKTELLEKTINKKDILYIDTLPLPKRESLLILNNVLKNLSQNPPKVSLHNVYENEEGKIESFTLYSDRELLTRDYKNEINKNPHEIEYFNNLKNEILNYRNQENFNIIKHVHNAIDEYTGEFIDQHFDDEIEQEKKSNSKTEEELEM